MCHKDLAVRNFPVVLPAGVAPQAWDQGLELLKQGAWRACFACRPQRGSSTSADMPATNRPAKRLRGETIKCYTCEFEHPVSAFEAQTVRALREEDMLWRAVCLKCTPASLRVDVGKPDVLVTCKLCKSKKSASCFLIDAFKKKRSQDHPKVCSDCNDARLRPTCTGPRLYNKSNGDA